MAKLRKLMGAATAAALLVTASAPAMARPGHGWGGGYYGGYRHHHNGDGFGNFLLGALLVGGVVAVASAASRDKQGRQTGTNSYPNDYPNGSVHADEDRGNWSDAENDAANVCADAAERVAGGSTGNARVGDIDHIGRDGDEYRVDGRMEDGRAFNCGVRGDALTYIQFKDRVAFR